MPSEWTRRNLAFAIALCALMGCKVGPEYRGVPASSPPAWTQAAHPAIQGEIDHSSHWWRSFNDPVLDELVQIALLDNMELKEAAKRILEVRSKRNVVAGNLLPQQQSLNGSFSNLSISENTANFVTVPGFFVTDRVFDNWNGNFGLAWELDFWGRLRRAVESADANVDGSVAAYNFVRTVMLAELAQSYIEMRTIEARMMLVQQQIAAQQTLLSLAQRRFEEGQGDRLDVEQSKSNLHLVEYQLPGLETLRRQACHRICVLTGSCPVDLHEVLGNSGQIPVPSAGVAVGIPSDLLRRRPDLHVAERQLAAQSAKIGIAEAELYPHITLIGQVGLEAQNFNDLFGAASLISNVGPGFRWNILNYGRIKNQVAAERYAFERLYYAYQQAALEAYREAEDAQVSFVNGFARLDMIQRASQSAFEAARIGHVSYTEGAANLDRVLRLQQAHLLAESEAATARGDLAMSLVKVYLAMGGGWESPSITSPHCSTAICAESEREVTLVR
ncbi:efflux transporter outer membrane subunit [Neorhodopirellula pilleata]|uniref:Outer membrane protein OprM n=1 Tax=Neorhodopirellula pilleata TaxID=2714738 RepID=A0A5C6A153_9BACT|nr:efflux transporter outer membrane subunit [Neorhodopirellula pilleata]TWT93115.1 Outer membrane protein OprM precursor [Neorhodopirellula pilleata]